MIGHVCYSCLLPPDATLTPRAVSLAVSTVRNFWGGGLLDYLGVPRSVMDQITASKLYASEDEKRMAGLQYYLQTVPGALWGRIASALWWMEEQTALETVRQYLPHKPGENIMVTAMYMLRMYIVYVSYNVSIYEVSENTTSP